MSNEIKVEYLMEDLSFWKNFSSPKYLSYFIIFFANIIGWQGTLNIINSEGSTFNLFIFILTSIPLSLLIGKLDNNANNHRKFILIGFIFYIGGFTLKELGTYGFTLINGDFDSILITVMLGIAFGISTVAIGVYFAYISLPKERGKLQGLSYCIVFAFIFILPLEYLFLLSIIIICLILFLILYKPLSLSEETSKSIESNSYREVFKHHSFIYFVVSFLLLLVALPFIQIFFYYGSLPTEFGLIEQYSYFPLLSIFALIGGFLIDRGRKSMTLALFLILGLGFAIWGIIPETIALFLPILVTIWILFGVGNAFANVFDYIIPSDYASPNSRGKYIALFFIATNIGLLISILLQPFIINLPIATIALIVTFLILCAIIPTILTTEPLQEALAKQVDVKGIYVISKDGRCLFEMSFKDILIDVDLITSALSAVGSLIRESIHSEKRLKTIDHGDVKILIEYGENVNAAIISDKETPDIRKRLEDFLMVFERFYTKQLSQWAGDIRPFYGAYKLIEIYFGVYLPQK